jgi:hypothetical protein
MRKEAVRRQKEIEAVEKRIVGKEEIERTGKTRAEKERKRNEKENECRAL